MCDHYSQQFPFVRTVHKTNGGLSSARNAGLDIACGEFVYFFDSDDYIEDDTLETLYGALTSNDADLAVCGAQMEWETGEQQDFVVLQNSAFSVVEDYGELLFQIYLRRLGACVWNKLYKRSLIEKHNLRFALNVDVHSEDIYFNSLYLLDVKKVATVSGCQHACDRAENQRP